MQLVLEQALFFSYSGVALFVALVAFLWGSQSKIAGAGLMLASVVITNISYTVFYSELNSIHKHILAITIADCVFAWFFYRLYRNSSRIERNNWAGFVSILHVFMAFVNFSELVQTGAAGDKHFQTVINILWMITAIVCLFGFVPKSRNEAIGVLRLKWMYLKTDWLGRVKLDLREKKQSAGNFGGIIQMKNIDQHLGGKIREMRIMRELKREHLAELLGVSIPQIHRYEKGENRIPASTLYAIARYFDVPMDDLFEGISNDQSSRLRASNVGSNT